MAMPMTAAAAREIQTLFAWGAMGTWTDGELVSQFLTSQEGSEAAFRVLIDRHGPMVLGVCRRVLGDEHAAEDAFQTTFLVLVKKAGGLRQSSRLANWLYGVALRVANKEKARGVRRRLVERQAAEQTSQQEGEVDHAELRGVIDEEINRLPERYRLPLVLCHLQGLRHDEAARRLGCPVGTVESRLSRARERLRTRLAQRGLAPSAWAVAQVLVRPARVDTPWPSLVETTLRAAMEVALSLASRRVTVASVSAWGWSIVQRLGRLAWSWRAGTLSTILVVWAGIVAVSSGVHPVAGELPGPQLSPAAPLPQRIESPVRDRPLVPRPVVKPKPPQPSRWPSARAVPLDGITLDGQLDDWPKDLARYAIRTQFLDSSGYNQKISEKTDDPDAYFMVGYDRKKDLIYLAVVVHDRDLQVHDLNQGNGNVVRKTDAVEVYVDGTCSSRIIPEPSGDWRATLDAATMPVLQYVAVPGRVAAYADPFGANPSLVYARTRESRTKMKYRRSRDVTTYEWAIQAYDQYPHQPTRLQPGKRLGFEVAVVDKDTGAGPPTFLTWGPPPFTFKGCSAGSLGELILSEEP
jgi:RNA polymerase sigma factor (sigma-70 family)